MRNALYQRWNLLATISSAARNIWNIRHELPARPHQIPFIDSTVDMPLSSGHHQLRNTLILPVGQVEAGEIWRSTCPVSRLPEDVRVQLTRAGNGVSNRPSEMPDGFHHANLVVAVHEHARAKGKLLMHEKREKRPTCERLSLAGGRGCCSQWPVRLDDMCLSQSLHHSDSQPMWTRGARCRVPPSPP